MQLVRHSLPSPNTGTDKPRSPASAHSCLPCAGGRKPVSCRVVDDDHTDEELEIPYDIPSECTLTPHSIMLVTFE